MIELGADGMQKSDQTATFKNLMRGLAVRAVSPVSIFDASSKY